MRTSENIDKLIEALSKAMGVINNPEKNKKVTIYPKTGKAYGWLYADLPDTFDAVKKAYSENGLFHSTAMRRESGYTLIVARIFHKSGQWMESEMDLPKSQDAKDIAGNITYFTRYLFTALAGLAADQDLDNGPNEEGDAEYENQKKVVPPPSNGPKIQPIGNSPQPVRHPSLEQLKNLQQLAHSRGIQDQALRSMVSKFGRESSKDLTIEEFNELYSEVFALEGEFAKTL